MKYNLNISDPENIVRNHNIKIYPTFLYFNEDGKEASRMIGGGDGAANFMDKIYKALDKENALRVKSKRVKIEPYYALEYAAYMGRYCSMFDEANELYDNYFNNTPATESFSEKNMIFHNFHIKSVTSPILTYMLNNENKISSAIGNDKYKVFLKNKGQELLETELRIKKIRENSTKEIIEFISNNPIMKTDIYDFIKNNIDYINDNNYKKLLKNTEKSIKKYDISNIKYIIGKTLGAIPVAEQVEYKDAIISLIEEGMKYGSGDECQILIEHYKNKK